MRVGLIGPEKVYARFQGFIDLERYKSLIFTKLLPHIDHEITTVIVDFREAHLDLLADDVADIYLKVFEKMGEAGIELQDLIFIVNGQRYHDLAEHYLSLSKNLHLRAFVVENLLELDNVIDLDNDEVRKLTSLANSATEI